mmetsp:Transcript_63035/g.136903  ORF Transcript_63035/g.136903 Transcript_63035/m.136903 type:complete len:981 (-) Transcript_63035:99-3041(-)|eukprot:CAMPEP_0170597994 /NCGR_PEP_ID=MMETSP0224-20130122/16006_1 /TAXON_ID=285029 /ORGANISM="Togula jolla, Strain CCCM 725" /LENGTH=980 /DNA_ID=CAMNT_0010922507 /DNA_START=46 /DNA_END=2988 /DNA_ORIENTATION=-
MPGDGQADDAESNDGFMGRSETSKARKPRAIVSDSGADGDMHLPNHKKPREKDEETLEKIIAGIKGNRFCKLLQDSEIRAIAKTMEFYTFETGSPVVKQGDRGKYFFVAHEGNFAVDVGGKVVNELSGGAAFGAIALVHNCPRTASVVAKEASSVWACGGDKFREILKEHTQKQLADHRKFLDKMSLFDGLSPKEKERVGGSALTENVEPGERICDEDSTPTAVYFVKEGELNFVKGLHKNGSGDSEGGTTISQLHAGDCFGWRPLLFGRRHRATAVAQTRCTLVSISADKLKDLLGEDFAPKLEQSFILSVLRKLPFMARLSTAQRRRLAQAAEVRQVPAEEALASGMRLTIVIDGEVCGTRDGATVTLHRGEAVEDDALAQLEDNDSDEAAIASRAPIAEPKAGADGCRVAALSPQGLATALEEPGAPPREGDNAPEQAISYMRKVLLIKKVPIFRDLSDEQVAGLVASLTPHRYMKGDKVFLEGEYGNAFYIIASGEVQVVQGNPGKVLTTLGPKACFGERAILCAERRTATIEVYSDKADLWSVDRETFKGLVTDAMRSDMQQSITLQDTKVSLKSIKHVKLIGAGSFGSVRMVEHKRSALRYALKRIRKKDGVVPKDVEQECQLLGIVRHPFILRMVAIFETKGSIYILTELITGGQMYEQVLQKMGVLTRKQAQFYIGSLALILESLHEMNIAYRDLKPENVMLDHQGYLKLVDFGLAKQLDEKTERTFSVVGTVLYMAPEVVRGHGYGTECDIWSLGVMFFELVCGRLPFGDGVESEQDVLAEILDKEVDFPPRYNDQAGKKLLVSMMCKEPEKRIGSGSGGWEDIKGHKYFKVSNAGDLFSKIAGRELEPPVAPALEQYSQESNLNATVTLSDAEELGEDDPLDVGCRVLGAFKKFDINGDGKIDRDELGKVLGSLDPEMFNATTIDTLFTAADEDHDGNIRYEEFLAWIFSDTLGSFTSAVLGVTELDVHL